MSFIGLNPTNTLKSFRDMCLPDDMKNKRLPSAAETSPGDPLGPPLSKAVAKGCRRNAHLCVTACGEGGIRAERWIWAAETTAALA